MSVQFNHSILAARDRHESARFFATLLGTEEPTAWGPFSSIALDGGAFVQFAEPPVEDIQMQHYAFLVDDATFDAALAHVRAGDHDWAADPAWRRPREINTNHGGRGFYVKDPAGHGLELLTAPYA